MTIRKWLIDIKNNNYQLLQTHDRKKTIRYMLDNIGSTDHQLRDDLIYATFSHWMVNGELLEVELKEIYNSILTDKHIFYRIGELNTDSVFTRSFSILLIPLLLIANQKTPFLSHEDINNIKNKVIRYVDKENDLRGYVNDKGWAHAIAHTADAIDELGKNDSLTSEDKFELLIAIKNIVCTKKTTYRTLEDERLATAVVTIISNKVFEPNKIASWLLEFAHWEKTTNWNEEYVIITNIKSFLGCLYFRLCKHGDQKNISEMIKSRLIEIMDDYI